MAKIYWRDWTTGVCCYAATSRRLGTFYVSYWWTLPDKDVLRMFGECAV